MLNPQWKPRNLQMLYGGFAKPFQVSREDLLHGVPVLMVFWVALLWTSDALWWTRACGLTVPQESALVAIWTISS